jgi:glyoxylase-like metal-dependent hydrolase (beta-lactamase superfamily II)
MVNILEAKKITDTFYAIDERCSKQMVNAMYLVLGEKKAALIDTGLGLTGNLDSFVRSYTSLPVIVLSTHGHPDHIGANSLFTNIYLSNRDANLLPWALSKKARLGDLPVMTDGNEELCKYAETHAVGENTFPYKNIEDGDRFDLGGILLEAIAVPGHTSGSMCFLNRNDQYCLTGDAVTPYPWMWLDHSTPLAVYLNSLNNFKQRVKTDTQLYCGHNIEPLQSSIPDDLISAVKEIISGKTDRDTVFKVPYKIDVQKMKVLQHDFGGAHIIYNALKI